MNVRDRHKRGAALFVCVATLAQPQRASGSSDPTDPTAVPAPSPCRPLAQPEATLLVILPVDEELSGAKTRIAESIRSAASALGLFDILPESVEEEALTVEGGARARKAAVDDARVLVARAEEHFRQLEDEVALGVLAKATAKLASAHQDQEALRVLAEAHLLAGAIYLARDRVDGARQRLQRALDVDPDLAPSRERFTPRLLAEVAGLRAAEAERPVGRLTVVDANEDTEADVYLDGRLVGRTPVSLESVGVGRHLVRIAAKGKRSHIASVDVLPESEARVVAQLPLDPELSAIMELPNRWRAGLRIDDTLELLAARAEAQRTLLVVPTLSSMLGGDGLPAIAVTLRLSGAPSSAFVPTLDEDALGAAMAALARCEALDPTPKYAPPLMALAPPGAAARPVIPPPELWERPWFWAGAAFAAVLVSSALVAARAHGGPPEAIEITLIPRP